MFCRNCGKGLDQKDVFCPNCGSRVEKENNININGGVVNNQLSLPESKKVKNTKLLIVFAVIGSLVFAAVIFFIIVILPTFNSEKLVCSAPEGSITLIYNKNGLTGYISKGIDFDMHTQNKYVKEMGIDAYLTTFNDWFTKTTSGTCTINDQEVQKDNRIPKDSSTSTTTIGDTKYGYIDVPTSWTRFYDISGTTALQYSYGGVYIISIDYFENSKLTAQEYASNFMYNKQMASDVIGVTGATVTIGKNKEYTAYQVYMYYPADSVYLVTYWFEAEDGKVHYIALEGPNELNNIKITDYLFIPESFNLDKS